MDGYKIVLTGMGTVGKTSITNRILRNKFSEFYNNTIGAAYGQCVKDGIKMDIWDTAGQERFKSLVSFYYRFFCSCEFIKYFMFLVVIY